MFLNKTSKQNIMQIQKVTVFGAGVLGTQVAWQIATHGYQTWVYDIDKGVLDNARKKHHELAQLFVSKLGYDNAAVEKAFELLHYTTDLQQAVENTDLTSESIPEKFEIKRDFYKQLSPLLPDKTILTTNSSTMVPSMFAEFTGRPEKFLALHFANPVWKANIAEIMGHQGTSKEVFDVVVDFARSIGLVPIPIYKEQPGYVLNSLLVPWLTAAETLYFDGVADFKSIDKTWMISTGSPIGPFGIIDIIGMQTLYNVIMLRYKQTGDESFLRRAKIIKEQYIDKGKLGIAAGEGFYKYPNPEYQRPDFLKK